MEASPRAANLMQQMQPRVFFGHNAAVLISLMGQSPHFGIAYRAQNVVRNR